MHSVDSARYSSVQQRFRPQRVHGFVQFSLSSGHRPGRRQLQLKLHLLVHLFAMRSVGRDLIVDLLAGIQDRGDRHIVVQIVDDEGDVLRHIDADVPRLREQLRLLVDQVRGEDTV